MWPKQGRLKARVQRSLSKKMMTAEMGSQTGTCRIHTVTVSVQAGEGRLLSKEELEDHTSLTEMRVSVDLSDVYVLVQHILKSLGPNHVVSHARVR